MKLATLDTGGLGHAAVLSRNNDLLDLVTSGIAADAPSAVKDILGHDEAMDTVSKALDTLEASSDDEQQNLRQSGALVALGEAEFCFVLGRTCHNVGIDDVMDYVAGYTIGNAVSARDWVGDVFSATEPFPVIMSWERNAMGKLFPTFTPCGPVITTKDEIIAPTIYCSNSDSMARLCNQPEPTI